MTNSSKTTVNFVFRGPRYISLQRLASKSLVALVGISHSSAKRCKQKPKTAGHDGKEKREPQTDNFGPQKTVVKPLWKVERVDFSTFWWINDSENMETRFDDRNCGTGTKLLSTGNAKHVHVKEEEREVFLSNDGKVSRDHFVRTSLGDRSARKESARTHR